MTISDKDVMSFFGLPISFSAEIGSRHSVVSICKKRKAGVVIDDGVTVRILRSGVF